MAAELWNRVNIPRPGAVCTVRVPFTDITGSKLKCVLERNDTVLSLLRSELLQTDVRVLYELLYVLNNSFRGNQTFRGLKRVEQCINRLKSMKLDEALQEVHEFFPKNVQRKLSIEAGEGDVPSQPLLEWLCLKVLGGTQLMSYTLQHCTTAFTLSRQQMMWGEFLVLNMVVTSLLSRLWMIFRGILVSLSVFYQPLLELLREVSSAKPMPFLTDFSLPTDIMQFLGLSDAFLQTKLEECLPQNKDMQQKGSKKKNLKKRRQTKRNQVDLGVAIQRAATCHSNLKRSQKVLQTITKVSKAEPVLHQKYMSHKKKVFTKQMRRAATFTEMVTHLDNIIPWCQKQQMTKQGRFLSNLRHQCKNLKKLEGGGHNLHMKLKSFKHQVCRIFSRNWTAPKPPTSRTANTRKKNHLNSFKHQLSLHLKRDCMKIQLKRQKMQLMGQRKGTKPSERTKKRSKVKTEPSVRSKKRSKVMAEPSMSSKVKTKTSTHSSHNDDHDDIDDIFASAGL